MALPRAQSPPYLYEAGKRIAQGTGDTLSYTLTEAVGQSLDLLAVAVAVNAPVMRAGWPQPMQQPAPDVQGWTAMTITVSAPMTGTGGSGGGGARPGGGAGTGGSMTTNPPGGAHGGCHCRASTEDGRGGWPLVMGAMIALARRRVRSPRRRETPAPRPGER